MIPQNLLIDNCSCVKLIGLGQALYTERCQLTSLGPAAGTSETIPIGSYDYMAPEQALQGNRVDGRADIYGLGCTMFTALTAQVVYPVDNPTAQLVAQRDEPPPSLTRFRDDVSEPLDAVFQRMVHPNRNQRFSTMGTYVVYILG